jgi:uncharacterized glyoxalase superfamily protein PhnB
MTRIQPVIRYQDARAAMAFLERAFGFHTRAAYDSPDGGIAHAELTFDTGTVGISSAGPVDPANVWTTVREGVYVTVADADAHHAAAVAAGAVIERPLQDQSYGAREYTARDVGGHLWSFGTYAMNDQGGAPVFIPDLLYADGHAAIAFLARAFGFVPGLTVDEQGRVIHAELWMGDEVLMLGGSDDAEAWFGRRQCTQVVVADPDAHCARARAAGATILVEPHDTPYGARAYVTRDTEGFVWGFSTYRPARTAAR